MNNTDILEKMTMVAAELEAAYGRLNAEIERQEELIRATGLTANDVEMMLKSPMPNVHVHLLWRKRGVGDAPSEAYLKATGHKMWRLVVRSTVMDGKGTPTDTVPLTNAPLATRIEAFQRLEEFQRWLLADATRLVNTLNENFPEVDDGEEDDGEEDDEEIENPEEVRSEAMKTGG